MSSAANLVPAPETSLACLAFRVPSDSTLVSSAVLTPSARETARAEHAGGRFHALEQLFRVPHRLAILDGPLLGLRCPPDPGRVWHGRRRQHGLRLCRPIRRPE
eukprot:2733671-Rhodomonas_salina.1